MRHLLFMATVLLTACSAAPAQNYAAEAFGKVLTLEEARTAVHGGGTSAGWLMEDQSPGETKAVLLVNRHRAMVDISFDESTFSVTYNDSLHLGYDGVSIHKAYNKWVSQLVFSIKRYAREPRIAAEEDLRAYCQTQAEGAAAGLGVSGFAARRAAYARCMAENRQE